MSRSGIEFSWESNIHVLFLTFHLPSPSEPGAARPWEELRLMRELGWDVTVITASSHYLTGEITRPVKNLWRSDGDGGCKIIRTWSPYDYRRSPVRRIFCYLAYAILALLSGLCVRTPDVIFCGTDPSFATPVAYILSIWHGARLILDERDLYPETLYALGMTPPTALVYALTAWNRWLRRKACAVITVSPGLYKLLLRNGASAGSTFVIPNYFGEADLEERSASANPDQDHSKTGDFIVVYAGSLGQAANVSTCLDAADILMRRGYTALRFVFMGAGERRQEYMTSCRDRGLDNVEFPGVVPRSYMQAVFAKAHVAVHAFPQHPYWRCALSSKVFEYMHAGIPIVFSGEGDIASVIKESGGGIVVPPEDPNALAEALVHLMETPGQRALMGNRAAEYVRTCFSRDSIRETFAEAFRVHGGGFTI